MHLAVSQAKISLPLLRETILRKHDLIPKWHRIKKRLALLTVQQLENKQSGKKAAQMMHVSLSTVGRWLRLSECGRPDKLPAVLSIDAFMGNTDPKDKCVLDILLPCRSLLYMGIGERS